MQRSRINRILIEAEAMLRSSGHMLPPFAYWSASEMQARRKDINLIVSRRLGWDVTDYGKGNFDRLGLCLFTLRNGDSGDSSHGRGVLYAEKLMISRRDQLSPLHTHLVKVEDIINRGGGTLVLKLQASTPEGLPDEKAQVDVTTDGVRRVLAPDDQLRLAPGESVTLLPGQWHAFWAEQGDVLVGEVSTVNDDLSDNRFADPLARFTEIDEDEPPLRLLVSDYPTWLG